jgi:hypothetical protein
VDSDSETVAINFWWKGVSERIFDCDVEGKMDNYYARVLLEKLVHSEMKKVLSQQQEGQGIEERDLWNYNSTEFCQLLNHVNT